MTIFGIISKLQSFEGTLTFIGFLLFLVLLEWAFSFLEHAAEIRDMKELFDKLEKELMMMGIISFAVFIFDTASPSTKDGALFLSFEMTHIIVLFMALAFIFQAVFLVSYASVSGKRYLTAMRTASTDLLKQYKKLRNNRREWWWFHHGSSFLPAYPGFRTNIEFRIIERLFIYQHKLSHDFNFACYVNALFKVYTAELGEVSSFSWFLLACLVALNYLRIALIDPSARGPKCGNVPSSSYVDPSPHRLLGGGAASRSSIACDTYVLIYAYFAMILLTFMAVGVYYIATVYLDRIIHKSLLIDKIADKGRHAYEKSLVLMIRKDKMLAHGISTVALNISEDDDGETEHGHGHGHGKGHGHGHKKGHGHGKHAAPSHTSIQVTSLEDDHHESDPPEKPAPKGSYALFRRTSAMVSGFGEAFAPVGGGDLSDIFLFKSPGIFFKAVEAVLLFQCFAISIVFTQLLPLNVSTAKGGGWYIGFILLIMMNFYIIQMILNKSVLLRSVHSLERAIAGKICEDTVAERTAIANLREVVTAKLVHERIPVKERRSFLKTYFFQYDSRQTGEISRAEFLRILGDLNIYMSTESFGLLWQVVDNDLSNKLDWLEISELFFPAAQKDDAPNASQDIPAISELRASMHKMLEDAKIPVFNWEEYIHTAFNKYDTDGSEEIDEVEFGAMLTSLDVRVTTKVLREVFSTIDLCQDGSISYDDFFAFIFPEIN